MTVSWAAVSGATTYNLYYSTASLDGLSVEQLSTPPESRTAAIVKALNLAGASHTITELANDTTYYAVVTANTAVGESVASTEASATPQAPVPTSAPGAPTNLSLTPGNAQVTAS